MSSSNMTIFASTAAEQAVASSSPRMGSRPRRRTNAVKLHTNKSYLHNQYPRNAAASAS